MTDMRIDVEWLPPFHGKEEVARTSAEVQIRFGDENATRFDDEWSQSVQQRARVSAYPLALWLAASWWRIRWEPLPSRFRIPHGAAETDVDWRMSHELPAAGYGFVWPQLTFASDGESIQVRCRRSRVLASEPVRYLADFERSVSARDFERAIDGFLELVLRRLDALGETDLHLLWREVLDERADENVSIARRLEARLGFEPDDAPRELIERFLSLISQAGQGAIDEVAPVCAGSDPSNTLSLIEALASQSGARGKIDRSLSLRDRADPSPPWERGCRLADAARAELRLGKGPLDDATLAGLLHLGDRQLRATTTAAHAPMGLAIRTGRNGDLKLLFRKRNRPARRFEAARFIGDHLCATEGDRWLPVTDSVTARQKVQRAFAAQFLCPIESLKEYLGEEFLPASFEDAAEYFGISELAVKSHLANNDVISRNLVDSEIVP